MSWREAAVRRQAGSPEVEPGNGFQALIVSREAIKRWSGNRSLEPNEPGRDFGIASKM